MNRFQSWGLLVGRILLALIFVGSGIGKIGNFAGTAGYMARMGMPLTEVLLVGAILIEVLGGLALAAGFKTRWAALAAYEAKRLAPTSNVVLENRRNPPDAILREIYERTGDRPFARIEDVIGEAELREISERYKRVAGYDRDTLRQKEITR